jgi:hypothetical protein
MGIAALTDWQNFYVIVGSAAGGLTGLTFVVITLAGTRRPTTTGLRAFVTPTIVHFGAVLTLAAFICVPHQSVTSLSAGLGAIGIGGLIYVGVVAASLRGVTSMYIPVHEDWIWNVAAPALVYGALVAMAILCWQRLEYSLYGVAAASVLLLFTGIHNAWDVAVWNTIHLKPGAAD